MGVGLRIGVMLRHFSQNEGGVRVYTHRLLDELLTLEVPHEFVLLYRDPALVGTYGSHAHVREVVVPAANMLLWDQVAANRAAERAQVDVLFNPKYSLPLRARCPGVFVCHGLDWYVMPQHHKWPDRLSHKFLVPRYARKATDIIAVSETTREHVLQYLPVEPAHVHRVYHGVDSMFHQPVSPEAKARACAQYALPDRYVFFCGQFYPAKNLEKLIRAYAKVGPALGISLVLGGEHRYGCEKALGLIPTLHLEHWVQQPGWIAREALPACYALAAAMVMPSVYESFGLPLLEAMASGCPVVTADRYGTKEIVGDAGLLVNPYTVDEIAEGIRRAATDAELRETLVRRGRERAATFTWAKCARETLAVLEGAA